MTPIPTLSDLPPAPPGLAGWPWTEASPPQPDTLPDGSPWPRLSLVTPSYNQGHYLEQAIRSVLLQGYPNLEYIIMDGGSTDQSVEVIRRYEPWLAFWVSEKDRGQSDAINKGLARATGDLLNWFNCDDVFYPGAFHAVARAFHDAPGAGLIYWDMDVLDADGKFVRLYNKVRPYRFEELLHDDQFITTPTAFFSREAWQAAGPVREDLHFVMDWDLYLKMGRRFPFVYRPGSILGMRHYPETKSASGGLKRAEEIRDMLLGHGSRAPIAYYKIGLWYYQHNQMSPARRNFWKALRRGPSPAVRRLTLPLLFKSLLPARVVDLGRAVHARLMARRKRRD